MSIFYTNSIDCNMFSKKKYYYILYTKIAPFSKIFPGEHTLDLPEQACSYIMYDYFDI